MSTTLIAIFPSRQAIINALDHLARMELVKVGKAAVVAKAANGRTIVVEDNNITPQESRRAGGSLGALMTALGFAHFGALALPGIGPILAMGVGALFGGLVGGITGQLATLLIKAGFKKEQIESLSGHLKENEVALVLQLEERDSLPQIRSELSRMNVELLENPISDPQ